MKKTSSKRRPHNPYIWLRYLIISACAILLSFIFLISLYGKEIVNLINESTQPIGDGTRYIFGFIPLPFIADILQKEQELLLTALKSILSLFDSVK